MSDDRKVIELGDTALDLVNQLGEALRDLGQSLGDAQAHNLRDYNLKTLSCLKAVETRLHTTTNSFRRDYERIPHS